MKTYLIQRNLPNAGNLSQAEQIAIAKRSVSVIKELGPDRIEWQHSYITADNLWCIYNAENEEILVEHAKRGQFPCDNIREIKGIFSPATALMTVEGVS